MRPCIAVIFLFFCGFLSAQNLVINEFVASNDSTSMIVDEFDESDDWVELYNNSTETIDLSGYYFSDDATEPDKWRFPNGISIPGEAYLIVWTDSDDEQGDLHTSFKLAKSGEHLILSDSFLAVVDSITFGEQETNVALARIPNGTGNFTPRAPTFNANNDAVAINTLNVRDDFEVYPSPAKELIQLDFSITTGLDAGSAIVHVSGLNGKSFLSKKLPSIRSQRIYTLNISQLPPGLYFMNVQTEKSIFIKKIVVQ